MIVALAGGVGAAKLVLGLSKVLSPEQLIIIGNTGDDLKIAGLRICPDLDTILYTLAGRVNPETGWGVRQDSFHCMGALVALGGPSWFQLGDQDLALHLLRTHLLREGFSLSEVTESLRCALRVPYKLLPMCDSYTPTYVDTDQGELHLQEYLVREQCRPKIRKIVYRNSQRSRPAAGVQEAILSAEAVLLCPSNPFISIGPILAVPGLRELLTRTSAVVAAVSPIVGGRALKGPAARMLEQLGFPVSAQSVAGLYAEFLNLFILDKSDLDLQQPIAALGCRVLTTNTIMETLDDKIALARRILNEL